MSSAKSGRPVLTMKRNGIPVPTSFIHAPRNVLISGAMAFQCWSFNRDKRSAANNASTPHSSRINRFSPALSASSSAESSTASSTAPVHCRRLPYWRTAIDGLCSSPVHSFTAVTTSPAANQSRNNSWLNRITRPFSFVSARINELSTRVSMISAACLPLGEDPPFPCFVIKLEASPMEICMRSAATIPREIARMAD